MTPPAIVDFIKAMDRAGMPPVEPVAQTLAEGRLVRFKSADDRRRNGWAVFFAGERPAGVFGNYRLGLRQTWRAGGESSPLTLSERKALRAKRREAEAERQRLAAAASNKARAIFGSASPASDTHPYLVGKQLQPFGIRQKDCQLVIPMVDGDYQLWNLQLITEDGSKRFLPKARTTGVFWAHHLRSRDGSLTKGPLVLAEGYGTAAACHEATGWAVVAAMSVQNLSVVAQSLRLLSASLPVIIAADWDGAPDGGLGTETARRVAAVVNARLALPLPTGQPTIGKLDFADLSRADAATLLHNALHS